MDEVLSHLRTAKEAHLRSGSLNPFICATWAQSLDGFISVTPGVPTAISCPETFELAHEIRALHDSILVGIGTLRADNPRLNARLQRPVQSPRPIVLDSNLQISPHARVFQLERQQKPIVLCKQQTIDDKTRTDEIKELGHKADLRPIQNPISYQHIGLHLPSVFAALHENGIQSVMIEGGGRVLNSVLSQSQAHFVVVTVAPRLFGGGVPVFTNSEGETSSSKSMFPYLRNPTWHTVGTDIVLCGVPNLVQDG